MTTTVHFIDVGQGNMVLLQCGDGTNCVVDCNVTQENSTRVLGYVASQIGQRGRISVFVCTHRDADHMRGVHALHNQFPIGTIWDSGHPGTSPDTDEYRTYMQLRRELPSYVVGKGNCKNWGTTHVVILSGKDSRLPDNANDQGLVLKVTELDAGTSRFLSSTMLTGDGSYAVWRDGIMKDYASRELFSDILMAAHHGSLNFFDDPNGNRYESHMKALSPAMTIVSVGPNNYGHPDPTALRLYEKHSRGSRQGNKVLRTDRAGTLRLTLKSAGGWQID